MAVEFGHNVDVCPVEEVYSEDHLPDGSPNGAKYNAEDPNEGNDHTFFVQRCRDDYGFGPVHMMLAGAPARMIGARG